MHIGKHICQFLYICDRSISTDNIDKPVWNPVMGRSHQGVSHQAWPLFKKALVGNLYENTVLTSRLIILLFPNYMLHLPQCFRMWIACSAQQTSMVQTDDDTHTLKHALSLILVVNNVYLSMWTQWNSPEMTFRGFEENLKLRM